MSTPPVSKYIPISQRPGFNRNAKGETAANYISPMDKAGDQLKALGFVKGTSGNYYLPENHPHVHVILRSSGAIMAYSEGKQHEGGSGLKMYEDKKLANYQSGVEKMKAKYPDNNAAEVLNQAVVILNAYCAK